MAGHDKGIGRSSRAVRKANAALKAVSQVCWLCGEAIDITLHHNDPMAWTADHLEPLALGGAVHGKRLPAHRRCNSSRGDTTRVPKAPQAASEPAQRRTRAW